jgi:hypothetical protein
MYKRTMGNHSSRLNLAANSVQYTEYKMDALIIKLSCLVRKTKKTGIDRPFVFFFTNETYICPTSTIN